MTFHAVYIHECLLIVFKNGDEIDSGGRHGCNIKKEDLLFPYHRLTLSERGPYYMCIRFFNGLHDHVKRFKSIGRFKKDVKDMLTEREPNILGNYSNLENLIIIVY